MPEIRVRLSVGPLKRKVAGYGLPGRTANACPLTHDVGSNPMPSADHRSAAVPTPMVKRRSCLASNEVFQVQILVGVLEAVVSHQWPVVRED